MTAKRRFRRVVLPTLWLAIGAVTAASLASLAFGGGSDADSDVLVPTATLPADVVPAEISTIENTLSVDATVTLDPAVDVPAPDAGTLVFVWARNGASIEKGAPLYQLKVEGEVTATDDEGEEADAPAPRFVTVVAPASGRVSGLGAALGDEVEDAAVVARVASTRYTVRGSVTPLDRYRLLDLPRTGQVTIQGGPEPFECSGLRISDAATADADAGTEGDSGDGTADPAAGPEAEGGEGGSGGASVTCRVPSRITVFDGLTADLEIDAGSAEDVLTVPVTAVQGLLERGAVWVVGDDGEPVRREVELGVSDGTVVQVRKGLEEGTEVLLYVPGSSPQDSADGEFADEGLEY